MARLDFYYNNQKVNEDISNWRDFEIDIYFEGDNTEPVVSTGAFEFVGSLAEKLNNHVNSGLSAGTGIYEPADFKIEACDSGITVFKGCPNLADCSTTFECDRVVAPLRHEQIDSFMDRASSLTFAYLDSIGSIPSQYYTYVPYVINSIPDFVNVSSAGISLFIILKEFQEVLEKTISVINEIAGDLSMTVASAANPVTLNVGIAMAIGRVLVDILRVTLYIIYLIFIINAMIALVKLIFSNLIQPVKNKKAIKVGYLFSIACNELGYQFKSSFYQGNGANKDDVIIPRKNSFSSLPKNTFDLFGIKNIFLKDNDDLKNSNAKGYFEGTFADLIRAEEMRLNAEFRIFNNIFYFEPKDSNVLVSNYTLPNIKGKNGDPHKTNACDLAASYFLTYQLDDSDTNTYDLYEGTSCMMTLEPKVVINQKNVLLKNFTEIRLPYALAKRKEELNPIEEIFNEIYNVVAAIYNAIITFINAIIQTINVVFKAISALTGGNIPSIPTIPAMVPNPFATRIGCMLLSSDFIGVQKICKIDSSGKLSSDNKIRTAARTLIDENHYSNFAIRTVDTYGNIKNDHNQYFKYENKEIPLCCNGYLLLAGSKYFKTYDKKQAKYTSLKWNPYKETAIISYKVKQKYTNNLKQTYIIDGQ